MVTDDELILAAFAARRNARAPYSGYAVGAAVRTRSGAVFTGCNVEVSSYSLACCAERVAAFSAVAAGQPHIVAVALVTDDPHPVTPCGACRQVLHELGSDMNVIMATTQGERQTVALSSLLPRAFGADGVLEHIHERHHTAG